MNLFPFYKEEFHLKTLFVFLYIPVGEITNTMISWKTVLKHTHELSQLPILFILAYCLFWHIVYYVILFILVYCLFWFIVYSGILFILACCLFWHIVYSGILFILAYCLIGILFILTQTLICTDQWPRNAITFLDFTTQCK